MPKKVPTLKDLRRGIGRPVPPPPFTQKQVERIASTHYSDPIDQTTLSKIESGKRHPSDGLLYRLSVIYGVDYEFIRLCAEETRRRARRERA